MPWAVAFQVLDLPSVLAYPLFSKLVVPAASVVTRDAIEGWLQKHKVLQVCMLHLLGSFIAAHL